MLSRSPSCSAAAFPKTPPYICPGVLGDGSALYAYAYTDVYAIRPTPKRIRAFGLHCVLVCTRRPQEYDFPVTADGGSEREGERRATGERGEQKYKVAEKAFLLDSPFIAVAADRQPYWIVFFFL